RTTLSGNSAGTNGGAIAASGNWIVSDSTISNNRAWASNGGLAGDGGGIEYYFFVAGANFTLRNSTVSGNTAQLGGGLSTTISFSSGSVTVENSTIASNSASYYGGGIYRGGKGSISLESVIVACNGAGIDADIKGPVTANYCLIGNTSGA